MAAPVRFPLMMRRVSLLLLWLMFSAPALRANLIDWDWALRFGDDPAWAVAEPVGPEWRAVNLGISWERQNVPSGRTVWLRKDFTLPARTRDAELRWVVQLGAGEVEAYLNGQPLGKVVGARQRLSVALPRAALIADGPNRLALRVVGHEWTGGSNDDVVRLELEPRAATEPTIEELVVPADHVFAAEEPVEFGVRVSPLPADEAEFNVTVTSDFHEQVFARTERRAAAGGQASPRWEVGRLPPGFYQGLVRVAAGDWHGQRVFWLAVDPTRIASRPAPVADLDEYWERAKRELAAVPPDFRVVRDAQRSTARHHVYSVEMAATEGVTLRGWYVVPVRPGRHPAVLDLPGYGVAQQPEWFQDDDDLVHLALDIRGHGRSADVINPGFGLPGYVGFRVNEPERYIYKGAYLDCGRALDFLASRAEVDPARIAVAGGSQGGGLALAAAALFPERVKACVAGMPFLGAFAEHIRIRRIYRDEMQLHLDRLPGATWAVLERSMALVDTVNLAPRVRCPVLMGTGLFDDDCPSRIGFAAYNAISAPKQYAVYPDYAHLLGPKWQRDSRAWLRGQLGLAVR